MIKVTTSKIAAAGIGFTLAALINASSIAAGDGHSSTALWQDTTLWVGAWLSGCCRLVSCILAFLKW